MDNELNFGKQRRRSPKKAVMQIRIKNRNRKLYEGDRGGLYYKRSNGTKVYIDPRNTSIIRSPRRRRGRGAHKRLTFGENNLQPGYPDLFSPMEQRAGRTYSNIKQHYKNTPTSFLTGNMPSNITYTPDQYSPNSLFGKFDLQPGYPDLFSPMEQRAGRTYSNIKQHYKNTPTSFLTGNMPPNITYTRPQYGTNSLFGKNYLTKFGQYFH